MTTFTIIGLGEAGRLYAIGLRDLGHTVRGYDPFTTLNEAGITQHDDIFNALADADAVFSLVGASSARTVASQALGGMPNGAVYADLNTASPETKAALGAEADRLGVLFADVAVLAPVPRAGIRTPLTASGAGADRLAELLLPLDIPIESIGGKAGDAAGRKLLRSLFMKGLAAVILETIAAASAAGQEGWVRAQIAAELGQDGAGFMDRLIDGSHAHAARRVHEVADALDFIASLGSPAWVTEATHRWLSALDAENTSLQAR